MNSRYRIVPGARLAVRFWDGECVVHHALSNDTHRLSEPAGRLLVHLLAAEFDDGARPVATSLLAAEELEPTLAALIDLGLVTQC